MVKSMIAAVSGLKSHQTKMDVLGNNIANVNTWGFKTRTTNFQDAMYTNQISGSGGNDSINGTGGVNSSQFGYGTTVGSISTNFTTGSQQYTGNPLDCMIDGTGFFIVGNYQDSVSVNLRESNIYLSRVGILRPDNNGYLVDNLGNYVYGYKTEMDATTGEIRVIDTENLYPLQIPLHYTTAVDADGNARYTDDAGHDIMIDSNGSYYYVCTEATERITVDDNQVICMDKNTKSLLNIRDDGTYYYKAKGNEKIEVEGSVDDGKITQGTDQDGNIIYTEAASGRKVKRDPETGIFYFNPVKGDPIDVAAADVERYDAAYEGHLLDQQNGSWGYMASKGDKVRVPSDSVTSVKTDIQERYNIATWTIGTDGNIIGVDVNNEVVSIGKIAVASVENANGLDQGSGYLYSIGNNAGEAIAMETTGATGQFLSNYLEMANVDLASEIATMITTQRGYQANTKIITVTDEMLETLVNMKR